MAGIRTGTPQARRVLLAAVLGSGMAFLDTTVVNVALPSLRDDLGVEFDTLQWVLDGYLLTLGSLLLVGGALGDRLGRRRVFLWGLVAFALASVACGLAPDAAWLVTARLVQGVGAAALVPGSLSMIGGSFHRDDRSAAIGSWTAWSGITTAAGPLLGGWLVDTASWRWVFLLNVPLAAATWWAARGVPESRDEDSPRAVDVPGAVTVTAGLGLLVYGLIEGPAGGWRVSAVVAVAGGAVLLVAFVLIERRLERPMLPLELFSQRRFVGANLATFAVYAPLNVLLFLLVLELQDAMGYSALEAGLSMFPLNVLLLTVSPPAGRLAHRIGHRPLMVLGPLLSAGGVLLLLRVGPGAGYWSTVLPAVAVFGLGMATTVAPLTSAALSAVEERRTGVASGVNNAVARVAGLVGIALVPLAAGIAAHGVEAPEVLTGGFHRAMVVAAGSFVVASVVSGLTVGPRDQVGTSPDAG